MGELRKLQKTPTNTYFVSLPKDWIQKHGLERGSQVNIEVTADDKILVDPKYNVPPQPKVAALGSGPFLSREIVGRYLLGFDTINIEAKERIDANTRNVIKSTASSLAGLEIVEETSCRISLQSIAQQPFGFLPEKILQRNHGIVAGMIRDVSNSFINGDVELARSVISRDTESNRLYFLLVRTLRTIIQNPQLSDKLGITPIECLDYRLAASLIEGSGDACVQVASSTLALNGAKPSDELRKLLVELQSACSEANEQALKAFLSKDISIAENVRNLRQKVEDIYGNIEQTAKGSSVDLMPRILAVGAFLRQIYERSIDMADLVV